MELRYEERQRRYAEFPEPIRALQYEVPKVRQIMDAYACGRIITLQEALCQMVVELATDTEAQRRHMVDLMQRATLPPMPVVPEMPAGL